jgi:hypothetical protein
MPNRTHDQNLKFMAAVRDWLDEVYPGCQPEEVQIVIKYPLSTRKRKVRVPVPQLPAPGPA